MKRDFTRLLDITTGEGYHLLQRTKILKGYRRDGTGYLPLSGKTLVMIFEKASTRTRVSFEVGMQELGGYTICLTPGDTQMGRGEPTKDTARVLSRYGHGIMIRTFGQEVVDELARFASIPVINGLTDMSHPCQILSDLFTIQEFKGGFEGLSIAYVGDGNNVANTWIEAALLFGIHLRVASPKGFEPHAPLMEKGLDTGRLVVTHDPLEAAGGADVIYTDVWVSMGQEKEEKERKESFIPYRIDKRLLEAARKDAIVMHCLPAHRDEEISADVFERFEEVIFTQAENRLHAQKALLEWLLQS